MPTYEYLCRACSVEFEAEQKMSDPPHATCPACGGEDTKRLISHSSFVLKGSGWYVTDYARKNGGSTGTSTSSKAAPTDSQGAAAPAPATPAAPANPAAPSNNSN